MEPVLSPDVLAAGVLLAPRSRGRKLEHGSFRAGLKPGCLSCWSAALRLSQPPLVWPAALMLARRLERSRLRVASARALSGTDDESNGASRGGEDEDCGVSGIGRD